MENSAAPSPHEFVRVLSPALRQAAAIARALEGRVVNRPKPGEATPAKAALTVADSATQEALLVPLLDRFRAVSLEAEEDTPSVARFTGEAKRACVVVDPIDGTLRFYLEGRGPYAVMAGLAWRGRYEAALLALPREGLFLEAVRGEGAWVAPSGGPARASSEGRGIWVSDPLPATLLEQLSRRGYHASPACGGAIAVAPLAPGVCAGIRLSPKGGSISRRGRIGALIAAEAGAAVATGTGEPFPDAIDAPARSLVVASDSAELSELCEALRAADGS